MSESGFAATPPSLESLREMGAERLDPARFHYLAVLSQRLQAQPEPVRRILEGKLKVALADYGERFRQAQTTAGDGVTRSSARAPLAELNQYIQNVRPAGLHPGSASGLLSDAEARSEMASVRRFRQAWSRMAAEDQVDQAVGRGPVNAGPLNSHMLVLRSLEMMRKLSPSYLRRFLSHVDALLWLDQAAQKATPMEAKPARRSRKKK